MTKKTALPLILLIGSIVLISCEDTKYEFGDIKTPTNIQVSATLVGKDAENPDGDGSGYVDFSATADNASSYTYYFDGVAKASPSGVIRNRFTTLGVNTYRVVIKANGTGGASSSTSIEVQVFSSFSDEEAERFLAGANIGDSKKWYWQADRAVHIGLGPVEDDYGNGEFAYEAWWNLIQPWDDEKYCMYENEFVFTKTSDGISFEQTTGPAFVPGAYALELDVDGDTCHGEDVATNMFGVKKVTFLPSSSKAALEGSYNEEPYRQTTFEISEGGFLGWFVGSSTYDIISISEDELFVRIIQAGDGFAWYQRLTSTKPIDGEADPGYEFTDLVWEDNFNTDGSPDANKWTYDQGAGGWGNGESQTYTNNPENVIVSDGFLKITALKDGSTYTSARIKTQGLYEFTYGRVEVRAKLPASQGTWPAFWLLGANYPSVGWPQCGEIDIMEQTGDDKNTVLGTCHWFDTVNSLSASYGESFSITDSSSEFHLYTVEWNDTAIKIYVDNEKYYEFSNNENLPFNEDFFLILNIAMGGTLGGDIDTEFTQDTMEVDYVKIFK